MRTAVFPAIFLRAPRRHTAKMVDTQDNKGASPSQVQSKEMIKNTKSRGDGLHALLNAGQKFIVFSA